MQNNIINIDKELIHFRRGMEILQKDMPISVLCLPKKVERLLEKHGLNRVYDITLERLEEIKGLGGKSIDLILQQMDLFSS